MKKSNLVLVLILFVSLTATSCNSENISSENNLSSNKISANKASEKKIPEIFQPPATSLKVERILAGHDQDRDGIDDLDDIVQGGRAEVQRRPAYINAYYAGGYPPETEGVCTDVIWRALKDAGYNLKNLVDTDIKQNTNAYPRVNGKPEPNIDFRRVANLDIFFKRNAAILTNKIIPNDPENLKLWQGGDIVVYGAPLWHIGIVSDKRRADGVPLLIHNGGPFAAENDMLLDWPSPIIHHYRFPNAGQQ